MSACGSTVSANRTPCVRQGPCRVQLRRLASCRASPKGFGEPAQEAQPQVSPRGKSSPPPPRPAARKAEKPQGPAEPASTSATATSTTTQQPASASSTPTPTPAARSSPSASSSSQSRSTNSSQTVASTPQVVVDRMFKRMITCAGIPVATGIGLLIAFYYLKMANKDDFPMWIAYASGNLTFGGGLLGITYGILSTSWDPSREGSLLGWDEFRTNLPLVLNRDKK